MAVERNFTVQIVIMMTEEQGLWVKEQAEMYGVSQARIGRDTLELGRKYLAEHYKKIGVRKPVRVAAITGEPKRVARRKDVPEAQFTAPTAA